MPIYQPQLKRTDFRSFAPGAGVYVGPPRPRPPPPPGGGPSGACALAKDRVAIARTDPIAIRFKLIVSGKAMMFLFLSKRFIRWRSGLRSRSRARQAS